MIDGSRQAGEAGSRLAELQVIIPNLHWHYSGVTATNRMIAPRAAKLIPAVWLGPDAPEGIERINWRDVLRLWRRARSRPLVWHARRNNEMIVGLALKWLGWPLRLVFTSAAQREHSWLTRALVARMDAVIATTREAAGRLHRPATIINHGVDTDIYAPAADRERAFKEARLPGRYAIGCFGRVRAQKGTDLFVEAMCSLLPHYPDFSAVVIGAEAPDQRAFAEALKTRAREAGLVDRLVFLGELPTDEVPAWYRRVLIYVFTSRNEGFGLTLLEAMASGAALVAARAGAAELVVSPGETGVLVPTGDAQALTRALEPLMRNPHEAEAMGRCARERVLRHFSVGAEAERIVEVYSRVLLPET